MNGPLGHVSGIPDPRNRGSRRKFLAQLSALCAGALIGGKTVSAIQTDPATRFAAQWKRIKGGLPTTTMATCERVAAKLAPRAAVLLQDSQWEGRTYKAIVDELRAAGIYPKDKSNPAKEGGQNTRSSSGAPNASVPESQAVAATIPVVGPVVAAALLLIAAVLNVLEGMVAKGEQDQAGANKDRLEKIRAMELRLVKSMESLDDCALFGKKGNCKPA